MSSLPTKNEDYRLKEYWDKRYKSEDSFDWFKSYNDISSTIHNLIPDKSARILMLGCGNSKLSQEMYDDGYENIVNIDYSSVVIEKMKNQHTMVRPKLSCKSFPVYKCVVFSSWLGIEMDIRELQFEDGSFDVAIDKGTMDAMMTTKGDVWNPPQQVIEDCDREVCEVIRVLKKGSGRFIYLTFGQPHFRRRYLTKPATTLEVRELGDMFHYYLYIVRT